MNRGTKLDLPDDIVGMEEIEDVLNVLVYGNSGVGKTVFAAGAGLVLATESGLTSARRLGSKAKIWPITGWEDMRKAYSWIKQNHKKPGFPFKSIAVDSLEELQALALRWILDKNVEDDETRDPDLPSQGDHQKWQNMFKRMVKEMNAIPVNTVYTATAMQGEDSKGNVLTLPSFLGKGIGISSFVCAQMHAVGYMEKIEVKVQKKDANPGELVTVERRRTNWQAKPKIFAKDRSTMMGDYTDNLTWPKVQVRMNTMPEPKPRVGAAKPVTPAKPATAPASVSGPATAVAPAATPAPKPAAVQETVEDINLDDEKE